MVFARGQGLKHGRVDQNGARLMKGAEQIFSRHQIDAGFAADRSIDLGQHGGWDLDYVDAAHIDGGEESGYVADYAAAESDQGDSAICSLLYQLFGEILKGGKTFGALAVGHFQGECFNSRSRERLQQNLGPAPPHGRNRDHKRAAGFEEPAQAFSGAGKQAAANKDFIGTRRRGHWNADHEYSS